jgi:hypothetical protein
MPESLLRALSVSDNSSDAFLERTRRFARWVPTRGGVHFARCDGASDDEHVADQRRDL